MLYTFKIIKDGNKVVYRQTYFPITVEEPRLLPPQMSFLGDRISPAKAIGAIFSVCVQLKSRPNCSPYKLLTTRVL